MEFPKTCLGSCSWDFHKPDGIDHAAGCPTVCPLCKGVLPMCRCQIEGLTAKAQATVNRDRWIENGRPHFVAIRNAVMLGGLCVGKMRSKTMAKRTANALNRHVPNREGV